MIDPMNKGAHRQIQDVATVNHTDTASHLHRVEAYTAEAVHAPGEGADWTGSLLIPNVHLLAAR